MVLQLIIKHYFLLAAAITIIIVIVGGLPKSSSLELGFKLLSMVLLLL